MVTPQNPAGSRKKRFCTLVQAFALVAGMASSSAQELPSETRSAEAAAQRQKEAIESETRQYHLRYGPVYFRTGAGVRFGWTDNVFYSEQNRRHDFLINPEVNLGAFIPVSELNVLRLSLGLGYEYYPRTSELNSDGPLVNPDSELAFNIYVGEARIQLHDRFSYQESLFFNSLPARQDLIFNFNDVGKFKRWDNLAGIKVDYDFEKVNLSAGYDHENFESTTPRFQYLTRASELFTASAAYLLGDHLKIGPEGQFSLHNFDREEVLTDHWRARVGPFIESKFPQSITLRGGAGYDTARFDSRAEDSNYETYYAYGRISQETRLFTHSVTGGREHLLGDNANNLKTTYVRYSINSPIIEHVELGANAAVHFADEFGGGFNEGFTYYVIGGRIEYQIHKYWRMELAYQHMTKDSELALRDYDRNRVTFTVNFTF